MCRDLLTSGRFHNPTIICAKARKRVWSPHTEKDIKQLESVQRVAIKSFCCAWDSNYLDLLLTLFVTFQNILSGLDRLSRTTRVPPIVPYWFNHLPELTLIFFLIFLILFLFGTLCQFILHSLLVLPHLDLIFLTYLL